MFYDGNFFGMNPVWWIIWGLLLFWIFLTPYNVPGQRLKRDSPFYILQKRLAAGQISTEEFKEKKRILESGLNKPFKKAELTKGNKLYAT